MQQQVLQDKLSEFLMLATQGVYLYRAAAGRAADPALRGRFEQFAQETMQGRAMLLSAIRGMGGDPNHVSPTARLAQLKTSKLIETAVVADGLSPEELAASDLENIVLCETMGRAGWMLLQQVAQRTEEPGAVEKIVVKVADAVTGDGQGAPEPAMLKQTLGQAATEALPMAEARLDWARQAHAEMCARMAIEGPASSPERWQSVIITPDQPPIEAIHPRPMDDEGLLRTAYQHPWDGVPFTSPARFG